MRKKVIIGIALMLLLFIFVSSYTLKAQEVVDIAVISVTPSTNAVLQGEVLTIEVLIENQGTEVASKFYVTVLVDTEIIGEHFVKGNEALRSGEVLSITFEWDTTSFAAGDHTISANADVLPGEIDTADNTYIDGVVRVNVRDVAVISITVGPTSFPQGTMVGIVVRVRNKGTLSETFNVTVYYDETEIESRSTSMSSGQSGDLYFFWLTGKVAPGTYTIKTVADVVPEEKDTSDNTKVDGTVTVSERLKARGSAQIVFDMPDVLG